MRSIILSLSFFSFLFLTTCKPNEVTPDSTIPTVSTGTVSSITQTTASIIGNLTAFGTNYTQVNQHGFCYSSTIVTPTISDSKIELQTRNALGEFTNPINGLTANTKYYIRAFATNTTGTAYGDIKEFTTLQAISQPTVTTTVITSPTVSTATSGGNVTSDGGATVTVRGICWNTTGNPTITDTHTTDGTGASTFVSNLTGLTANTNYFVRAYATNSVGTNYGNQVQFTTTSFSIVVTAPINTTNWVEGTAQLITWNDNISDNVKIELFKGAALIETISSSASGNSISWTPSMTYLAGNDFKIKITGTTSTSITDEKIFLISYSTITDIDGNTYKIKQFGTQVWMIENLKVAHNPSGVPITTYNPNNDPANVPTYGKLYDWTTAMNGSSASGAQGICPAGWHIPTDVELTALVNYLGGETLAGGKLKEASLSHWSAPNDLYSDNSSGFAAVGSGYWAYTIGYTDFSLSTIFWASTNNGVSNNGAYNLRLFHDSKTATLNNIAGYANRLSVRCIKNL